MFFKNLFFFSLPGTFSLDDIEAKLAERPLRPVPPDAPSSAGFVAPLGREGGALTHQANGCALISLGYEDRILPASVINDHVAKRIREIEKQSNTPVTSRAAIKRIREQVTDELLPKAFVKTRRVNAIIDPDAGYLVVDTSSQKAAESFASEIRMALGTFPATRLQPTVSVCTTLSGWLSGEPMPDGVVLGGECVLKEDRDGGEVWRSNNANLEADEVEAHLQAGKQCTRLAVAITERSSFTIDEDMVVRKLKLDDVILEQIGENESAEAEMDAQFVLMIHEIRSVHAFIVETAIHQ